MCLQLFRFPAGKVYLCSLHTYRHSGTHTQRQADTITHNQMIKSLNKHFYRLVSGRKEKSELPFCGQHCCVSRTVAVRSRSPQCQVGVPLPVPVPLPANANHADNISLVRDAHAAVCVWKKQFSISIRFLFVHKIKKKWENSKTRGHCPSCQRVRNENVLASSNSSSSNSSNNNGKSPVPYTGSWACAS